MLQVKISKTVNFPFYLLFLLILYFFICWYLVRNIFYLEIDPDGISYISIAYKYLNHDPNAINAYWSPLYSWLLMPFLKFGVVATWASKYLNTFLGVFSLFGSWLLIIRFNINSKYQKIILLFLVPLTLYFSFFYTTPDLLLLVIVQFYLLLVSNQNYYHKTINLILVGLFGGLGYLTKSYFFFFFLLHFFLINLLYIYRKRNGFHRQEMIKGILISLGVFLIIFGAWAVIISNKYQKFSIGTAGEYNYKIVGPNIPQFPVFYLGFMSPTNDTAISSWEDPSFQNIENWSPLSSRTNFYYQIKLIVQNSYKFLSIIQNFSCFGISLLTLITLLWLAKERIFFRDDDILFSIVTILTWVIGYIFISVEARYLWIIDIFLIILGVKILNNITSSFKNKSLGILMVLIFLLSFEKMPIKELLNPITVRKDAYDVSQILKEKGIVGKFASNANWDTSLFIAYYLNSKYYGSDSITSSADINYKLKNLGINYFFAWGEDTSYNMENYQPISDLNINNLKVYQFRTN